MSPAEWAGVISGGGAVLAGAVALSRWVSRDEVAKAKEAADAERDTAAQERRELDRRVTSLEAQLTAKRADDERRFAEFREDLKELRAGIDELLRRVK